MLPPHGGWQRAHEQGHHVAEGVVDKLLENRAVLRELSTSDGTGLPGALYLVLGSTPSTATWCKALGASLSNCKAVLGLITEPHVVLPGKHKDATQQ